MRVGCLAAACAFAFAPLAAQDSFGNGLVRIFKGLSVQVFGSVGLIHDQLSIPRAGPTQQDVLLQRRQLATSYQYFGFFSLQYSFGSKFANIVNPRFEGSGGSFFISN